MARSHPRADPGPVSGAGRGRPGRRRAGEPGRRDLGPAPGLDAGDVLLANNTIQNLVEPFAFGARLRLHPLAVLITVTTAAMLFGMMGAILAAPLTSAAVNAYHLLRAGEGAVDPVDGSDQAG